MYEQTYEKCKVWVHTDNVYISTSKHARHIDKMRKLAQTNFYDKKDVVMHE